LPLVSTFPFGRFGRSNRQGSPGVFKNVPVFGRLRPETWFDRDCQVRAAVIPGIQIRLRHREHRRNAQQCERWPAPGLKDTKLS